MVSPTSNRCDGAVKMSPLVATLWGANMVLDTAGQLAFKAARRDEGPLPSDGSWQQLARSAWLWLGIACFVAEFVVWLAFLSLVPLSEGVLLGAVNILAIMLGGWLLFGERLSPLRTAGIVLIAAGVALVGVA
jgi:drug/metabolite transporter (DMT)-like permease